MKKTRVLPTAKAKRQKAVSISDHADFKLHVVQHYGTPAEQGALRGMLDGIVINAVNRLTEAKAASGGKLLIKQPTTKLPADYQDLSKKLLAILTRGTALQRKALKFYIGHLDESAAKERSGAK